MRRSAYWYKIDNAGKVFIDISKNDRSNVFRLSFEICEEVDKATLEQAVNDTLARFETFAVELKRGWFWYYFTSNKKHFEVEEESSTICKYFTGVRNQGYLFKVYYRSRRITLETFHALSDGTGALEFLKSIVFRYFILRGYELSPDKMIRSQTPPSVSEEIDMFNNTYDSSEKKEMKEKPAYQFSGDKFDDNYALYTVARVPTGDLLALAKKHGVTLGVYMSSVIIYAIYTQSLPCRQSKKPIKLFVPVNLRKYFPSMTLRNFSLYIKAVFAGNESWTFEQILESTRQQFKKQLMTEELHARINATVGIEKNPFIRILPLFIKKLGFKIGYHYLGEIISTCSFSNLGMVTLSREMQELVTDADFCIGGTSFSALSIHGHTNFVMSTRFKDLSITQHIISQLVDSGVSVIVDTNYQEGIDEIL